MSELLSFISQANAATQSTSQTAGEPIMAFTPIVVIIAIVIIAVVLLIRKSNRNFQIFLVLAPSIAWCVFLVIRTKSFLGQKFLMLSGSNIWDAKGIRLSENVYLLLWLVGIAGICFGLWLWYSSFVKLSATSKIPSEHVNKNQKKCPMCAELVQKEAKICKHCRHEF